MSERKIQDKLHDIETHLIKGFGILIEHLETIIELLKEVKEKNERST